MTLQQTDVTSPVYWRQPFESLATVSDLVEFVILDIEPSGPVRGKYVLADAQVTRSNTSGNRTVGDDGMGDDGIYHTRTHLGAILQPGDTVLGYHLTNANFNNEAFESLDGSRVPDVILVKKTYPNRRKKTKARNWKLRSIAKEAEDTAGLTDPSALGRGALGRRGGLDQKNVERDYELFLRDLEEDKEMRSAINLYKADPVEVDMNSGNAGSGTKGGKKRSGNQAILSAAAAARKKEVDEMEVEDDQGRDGDGGGNDADETDMEDQTDLDEEEDFPNIEMDELLEHFDEMDMADELDGGTEVL